MASSSSDPPNLKPEASGGGEASASASEAMLASSSTADEDQHNHDQNQQLILPCRGLKKAKKERGCTAKERISKMPPCAAGKRSSIYRGVTRHRWTGRYEAHLWDKSSWNQNQNKKGKQGAYDDEEAAARAYDLAALKYWGPGTLINFPVTDYTRDLDEMQNVSREEYLASLRRKSSGFSRGILKYRGLSSNRWEPSLGRLAGSEYLSVQYGDNTATESDFIGGFCIERKIDLASYIKWWGNNNSRHTDSLAKSSVETKYSGVEDINSEKRKLEWTVQPTEPYQMPRLGVSTEGRKNKGSAASALSILSRSAAYKGLQEKVSNQKETKTDSDENEIKYNKMDHGKSVEKQKGQDGRNERLESAIEMGGALSLQKNAYSLTPFLSAPLLTNYSSIDPLADPILWSSLVPLLPTGLAHAPEVTKTETSSTYPFFRQDE
ncbi:AP2/ERF domain [Dillenia turbinata]|uniref:AP2/ERF domain n=1 Tax=Dillenia turbinata TaxID=194707 RepID=A0AAN8W1E0_9MAGN